MRRFCRSWAGIGLLLALAAPTLGQTTKPVVKDVPYKHADALLTDYERERCKLDLYLPNETSFPVVVWFYGGGLESGDKARPLHTTLATTLARNGIGVAVVDYRLSPKVKYPAYLDDAAASVAWTIENISRYGGDPKRIFVSGHSAGGYLAAAIGMDPAYLERYGVKTSQLAGLLPVSPQVFTHFTIRKERGVANPEQTPVIDSAAPAYHARADAPAILVFVGDKDLPTRLEECQYFVAAMKAVKHPDVAIEIVKDRTHGSIAKNASQDGDPVLAAMIEFIKTHPKPAPATTPTTAPVPTSVP